MSTTVTARQGDTLCGLAIAAGFLNCDPIRNAPQNRGRPFLRQALEVGDEVFIPDPAPLQDQRVVDAVHAFLRRTSPPVAVRFVRHDSNLPTWMMHALTDLHISNFRTDKAGNDGQQAFSNAFAYNAHAAADPDAFKVEVTDPQGGGGPVHVKLEALKPEYNRQGRVTNHVPFTGAGAAGRSFARLECRLVSGSVRYASRYMRLVTNTIDKDNSGFADQCLLVTDTADGAGGAADRVEILDQKVKATYVFPRCAASTKCAVSATLQVGSGRKRLRICWHIFRKTAGGNTSCRDIPVPRLRRHLRYRTYKWLRRICAQVDVAPQLVGPRVEVLDPPGRNMLVISHDTGGRSEANTSIAYAIRAGGRTHNVQFNLSNNMSPGSVGDSIVSHLPRGFAAEKHLNTLGWSAADRSCDIIITANDGSPVTILNETVNGGTGRLTLQVPRIDIDRVRDDPSESSASWCTIETRRILRCGTRGRDRVDLYVVGNFRSNSLNGQAYCRVAGADADHRPPSNLHGAVILAYRNNNGILDRGDTNFNTVSHEIGHVVLDSGHVNNADVNEDSEVMYTYGVVNDSIGAARRWADSPINITYGNLHDNTTFADSSVRRYRSRGSPYLRGW